MQIINLESPSITVLKKSTNIIFYAFLLSFRHRMSSEYSPLFGCFTCSAAEVMLSNQA